MTTLLVFFGAFALDPQRPAEELEMAYEPGLTESERRLTIGELVRARVGGHPEYADRVALGPIELIVRDVDEKGRITEVGVSFEPQAAHGHGPVVSAGDIFERLRKVIRRIRRKPGTEAPMSDL